MPGARVHGAAARRSLSRDRHAAALGRGFTREELAPRRPAVAIISHRLWQSRFGGDPAILSRPIRIGGEAATIVGVMPPDLVLIGADLWIPWGADTASMPRTRGSSRSSAGCSRTTSIDERTPSCATIARPGSTGGTAKVQGIRRLAADRDPVGRGAASGPSARGVHPARRGWVRPADCVRQPHQSHAGAIDHAQPRTGRPFGARRGALADCPAAAHRKPAARRRGCRRRPGDRSMSAFGSPAR